MFKCANISPNLGPKHHIYKCMEWGIATFLDANCAQSAVLQFMYRANCADGTNECYKETLGEPHIPL